MTSVRHASRNVPQFDGIAFRSWCSLLSALSLIFVTACGTERAQELQSGPSSAQTQATENGSMLKPSKSGANFGEVVVGSTATKTVSVTSEGPNPITVSSYLVSGPPFSVTGLQLPVTLQPGQSLSFTAEFAPTATGNFSGSVVLTGGKSQATIPLTGSGVASTLTLSLSPNPLNFGNATVGSDSQLPVLVQNTGTGSVTVSSVSVAGNAYTISDLQLPETLSSGQSMSFTVTFTPTGTGVFNGTASLISNATTSPNVESLSGTGVSAHSVSLSWTASTSPGVLGYDVYRSTTSGGPYTEITASPVSGTSYTDTTVSAGETYYYVAAAVTESGESGYSNQATATVP